MVVDTHTHAWGSPSDRHPWTNAHLVANIAEYDVGTVYDERSLLTDMDQAGVDNAVVVGFPIGAWTDNWYVLEAVSRSERLSGVVLVDPFRDDAADRLYEYMAVEGILGFRLGAMSPYESMWNEFDPGATWLYDALEETAFWEVAVDTGALVELLVHESQLDQVAALVDRYPELTYVIDHFAYTSPDTAPTDGDFARLAELADYEGTVAKVSGIQHRSEEQFPYSDMHDHVVWLLDEFGRDQVVWGSDYPNVSDVSTYADSFEWLDHVDTLSDVDRTWISERAARGLFDR